MPRLRSFAYALLDLEALAFRLAVRLKANAFLRKLVDNPRTFNQWLRHKMVYDRDPLLVELADKIKAKSYIERVIGPGLTPATLQTAVAFDNLNPELLPREYALKVNHASGGVILVSEDFTSSDTIPDRDSPFMRLQLRSDALDLSAIGPLVDHWLTKTYGTHKGEWAYSQIQPRILVEEYIRSKGPFPPPDYKFFIFHGRCQLVRVDEYRPNGKFRFHFTPDREYLEVRFAEFGQPFFPNSPVLPTLPDNLDAMMHMAEALAGTMDFLRVDMYEVDGQPKIGELTLYPTSGTARFSPRSFDHTFGTIWSETAGHAETLPENVRGGPT